MNKKKLARLNIYAREPGIPRWKTATQALLAYVRALSPPLKGDHVTYRPIRAQYENQPGVTSQGRQNRNRMDVSDLVRVRVYAIVPNGVLSRICDRNSCFHEGIFMVKMILFRENYP